MEDACAVCAVELSESCSVCAERGRVAVGCFCGQLHMIDNRTFMQTSPRRHSNLLSYEQPPPSIESRRQSLLCLRGHPTPYPSH